MKKRYCLFVFVVIAILAISLCGCGETVAPGLSAYEIAVKNGFVGTETEWLASLSSAKSPYQIALEHGFVGSEDEWVASLKGDAGLPGKDGRNGADGKDAPAITVEDLFETAKENGFEGDILAFIREYMATTTSTKHAINKAIRSVVSVYSTFNVSSVGWSGVTNSQASSAGSGVLYSLDKKSGDAYIITNFHVVYEAQATDPDHISQDIYVLLYGNEIAVAGEDGTAVRPYRIPATYIGGAMAYDIAVLAVKGSDILKNSIATQVSLYPDEVVDVGTPAIAIGNPQADGISVTEGIISVDSETLTMVGADNRTQQRFRVMRVDTAVNHGNSGGGLFDDNGNLIGIVNAKTIESDVDNIAYAIPVGVASKVADIIIDGYEANGKTGVQQVKKYLLGVTIYSVESRCELNGDGSLEVVEKVRIESIVAGSIVEDKLQVGDIITAVVVDGKRVPATRSFMIVDAMLLAREGSKVTIEYERGGTPSSVEVDVGEPSIVQ